MVISRDKGLIISHRTFLSKYPSSDIDDKLGAQREETISSYENVSKQGSYWTSFNQHVRKTLS